MSTILTVGKENIMGTSLLLSNDIHAGSVWLEWNDSKFTLLLLQPNYADVPDLHLNFFILYILLIWVYIIEVASTQPYQGQILLQIPLSTHLQAFDAVG